MLGIWFACLTNVVGYGKHGGYYKESNEPPIDKMDECFKRHDIGLTMAFNRWQNEMNQINAILSKELNQCRPGSTYGKMYRWIAMRIFK